MSEFPPAREGHGLRSGQDRLLRAAGGPRRTGLSLAVHA